MSEQLSVDDLNILPEQKRLLNHLIQAFHANRLSHAYLLTGQAGIGKYQFAKTLSQFLLCEDKQPETACGQCQSCHLFSIQAHPDYLDILPQTEGGAIKIDQIREINQFFQQSAHRGQARIVIINPAEKLNVFAANSLLKILEEPVANRYLFLLSQYPHLLPITVRSRTQKIHFKLPSETQIQDCLGKNDGKYTNANNLPLTVLFDEEKQDQWKKIIQQLEDVFTQKISPIAAAAALQQDDLINTMDCWISHVQGKIKDNMTRHSAQNKHLTTESTSTLHQTNYINFIIYHYDFINILSNAKRLLLTSSSVNKLLLLEDLLISWSKLKSFNGNRFPISG